MRTTIGFACKSISGADRHAEPHGEVGHVFGNVAFLDAIDLEIQFARCPFIGECVKRVGKIVRYDDLAGMTVAVVGEIDFVFVRGRTLEKIDFHIAVIIRLRPQNSVRVQALAARQFDTKLVFTIGLRKAHQTHSTSRIWLAVRRFSLEPDMTLTAINFDFGR